MDKLEELGYFKLKDYDIDKYNAIQILFLFKHTDMRMLNNFSCSDIHSDFLLELRDIGFSGYHMETKDNDDFGTFVSVYNMHDYNINIEYENFEASCLYVTQIGTDMKTVMEMYR